MYENASSIISQVVGHENGRELITKVHDGTGRVSFHVNNIDRPLRFETFYSSDYQASITGFFVDTLLGDQYCPGVSFLEQAGSTSNNVDAIIRFHLRDGGDIDFHLVESGIVLAKRLPNTNAWFEVWSAKLS